ncbi:MAG: TlpA family protein disulfide reductase [Leptonema sp. (in: bacteria)]
MKLFFLFLLFFFSCIPKPNVDNYFRNLKLRNLENQIFSLSHIQSPVFLMNFYSPTCPPCVEELPALHLVYSEMQKYSFELFIAIEPSLENNLPTVPEPYKNTPFNEESMQFLIDVMKNDVRKKNIQIPVYIVEPPFKIDHDQWITGRPETLLFTTNPLRLHYNFVGPIATSENLEAIKNHTKYKFLLQILNQLHQTQKKEISNY